MVNFNLSEDAFLLPSIPSHLDDLRPVSCEKSEPGLSLRAGYIPEFSEFVFIPELYLSFI